MAITADTRPFDESIEGIDLQKLPRVYGPEAIVMINNHYMFNIKLNQQEVALPWINVGKDSPIWVAYVHVKDNQELARLAYPEMVKEVFSMLTENPNITTIMLPASTKSVEFLKAVSEEVKRTLSRVIEIIQLIGGENEDAVEELSKGGLVVECTSVISQAKGIKKYLGITRVDAEALKSRGGEVLKLDDVINTGITLGKMDFLINKTMNLSDETIHPAIAIASESLYGPSYPKPLEAHVITLVHIPEIIRNDWQTSSNLSN